MDHDQYEICEGMTDAMLNELKKLINEGLVRSVVNAQDIIAYATTWVADYLEECGIEQLK